MFLWGCGAFYTAIGSERVLQPLCKVGLEVSVALISDASPQPPPLPSLQHLNISEIQIHLKIVGILRF